MKREEYITLITNTAATLLAGKEEVLNPNYGTQDKQIERAVTMAGQIVDEAVQRANNEFATNETGKVFLTEKTY